MDELELLKSLKPIWLNRGLKQLARGSGIREDLRSQLETFFDQLEQVVETGDPSWLDSVLADWAASQTQSDLEGGSSDITSFVKELMILTTTVCREMLGEVESSDLISTLLPTFAYIFERISQYEIQTRVAYIADQLSETKQRLEKIDQSKSDFISVAAHELKTPLTLIEGYASMLRESCEKNKSSESELALLEGIHSGTSRLRAIIDDMIDVSQIDNNLMQLNFQPVWLNRILGILEIEFLQTIQQRRQTLEIHPFPGSNEMTFADPERLLQVLRNVLSNAIKYTPDGGRIVVEGRKLPGFIEITISDNGIGIDPDDTQIIFEKFERLGDTALHSSGKTKFKGGGPGLGLHIAKGIIESHGGTIWAESPGYDEEKCPGSTFHIMLPSRVEPPDDKMAKLFAPLAEDEPPAEVKRSFESIQ
jgi:signal transduction histidine kinase